MGLWSIALVCSFWLTCASGVYYVTPDGSPTSGCTPSSPCTMQRAATISTWCSSSASNYINADRGTYTLAWNDACGYVGRIQPYSWNGATTWTFDVDPATHIINGPVGTYLSVNNYLTINGFTLSGLGVPGLGTFNYTFYSATSSSGGLFHSRVEDCYAPIFTSADDGSGNDGLLTLFLQQVNITRTIDDAAVSATTVAVTRTSTSLSLTEFTVNEVNALNPSIYCSGNGTNPKINIYDRAICSADPLSCSGCTCGSLSSPGECQNGGFCFSEWTSTECGKLRIIILRFLIKCQ